MKKMKHLTCQKVRPHQYRQPVVRLGNLQLESRVLFNAALVGVTAPVPVGETTPNTDHTTTATTDHFAGCGCGACVRVVNYTEDGEEVVAYALPPYLPPVMEGPQQIEAPPYPGETFTLHSRPSSPRKIYLDFNGHNLNGTQWNTSYNGGNAISLGAFTFEGNGSSFTINEEERIQRIWQRVVEDFAPFDVDVTTEDPGLSGLNYSGGSDTTWGIRVIITPDYQWYGNGAGGVAYLNSFRNNRDTSCFVFSTQLGNSEKSIAEAISHEVGHTLGLGHDGTSTQGYYGGHNGSGTPGWAPIMGVGYYQELAQWSRGEYPDADNPQDDLAIITNTSVNFGYRPDDHGGSIATASAVTITGGTAIAAAGVVERTSDVDYFSVQAGAGNATFNFNTWVNSPNLDIYAELRDSSGTVLAFNNPANALTASISYNFPSADTYYLTVSGTGAGNPATNGYSDYGSLGQYTITGTVQAYERLEGIEASTLTYIENQSPLTLTSSLLINNGPNLNRATVSITNYVSGQDTLNFTNQGGITGNFNTTTGVLTLSGTANAATYQTALRSITYSNSSQDPATVTRTFNFQVRNTSNVLSNVLSRSMDVISVNDAPTLTNITDRLVEEDSGPLVVNLTGITAGGENQTLTITATSDNPTLIPNPAVDYTSPNTTGTLTFSLAPNGFGTANITVRVTDNGGTANGGVNQRVRTFRITVTPDANDAPILDNSGSPQFPMLLRNETTSTGETVATLIGTSITDPDPNPLQGIALVGATGINRGEWQYSLDQGTTWLPVDSVSEQTALLLRPEDKLRFVPTVDAVGYAEVIYRAWDQFTGTVGSIVDLSATDATGGASAFSTATETAKIYVAMDLATVAEDSRVHRGDGVSDLVRNLVTDRDANAKGGIAITELAGATRGQWQYSINGGRSWRNISAVSMSKALLLRTTDRVRFLPAQEEVGQVSMRYRAWDQTSGKVGQFVDLSGPTATGGNAAFSVDDVLAIGQVVPTNDRPTLDRGGDIRLTRVPPNTVDPAGNQVAEFVATNSADPDPNALQGIAITAIPRTTGGTWQYSLNDGATWDDFPKVTTRAALLLRATDRVRFLPNAGFNGQVSFLFKAWDQTEGTAGTTSNTTIRTATAYSTAIATAKVNVSIFTDINNSAPTLNTTPTPTFTPVLEDSTRHGGDSVGFLLGDAITDADAGALRGIALTGQTGTQSGRWEWSPNGRSWKPVVAISEANALLLNDTAKLRYVPNGNANGSATIQYRAWDRSRGDVGGRANLTGNGATGGNSAFSTAVETATVNITPVNDAPVLNKNGNPVLPPPESTDPAGVYISDFASSLITDVDQGALQGIAVTKSAAAFGTWQYSGNHGATWTAFVPFLPLSEVGALLLRTTDKVRVKPTTGASGLASFTFRAWDQTIGSSGSIVSTRMAGVTAFSKDVETVTMAYNMGNVRPMLDTNGSPAINYPNGSTVASLFGTSITDPNVTDLMGIAITYAVSSPKRGTWECSLDDGDTWSAMSVVSAKNALLLRATDRIRFVPVSGYLGSQKLLFKAWDQTEGTAGERMRPTGLAFSTAVETAWVNINTAPELDL